MLTQSEARETLRAAFAALGLSPSEHELQAVQAIGLLESNYGEKYANNWGNIQCGRKTPCPAGCVPGGDKDAEGKPYKVCFHVYDSPVEGAVALVKTLYKRPGVVEALKMGSARDIADEMRASGYYEAPASLYSAGLKSRGKKIASSLDEAYLLGEDHSQQASDEKRASTPIAVIMVGAAIGVLFLARRH